MCKLDLLSNGSLKVLIPELLYKYILTFLYHISADCGGLSPFFFFF
jgi:hypothetical protein